MADVIYVGKLKSVLLAGVALALLTPSHHAAAQQAADGATALEPIAVTGQRQESGTGPVDGYVAKVTTTGSKTDTPIALVPQSISVIGRQQMDDLGAMKTDEAVRYSAGVFAQPFGEDSDTNWFYIRGFDATQTGVYRDGMQLYSYAFGNFFQDPYLLERVEVLRGASSALYGGGNIGGIINYVSKRPLDANFGQVEVGIDNYPTAFAAFDINRVIPNDLVTKGDPLPPVWKYRVTGKIEGGDGNSDREDGFRGVIQGAATYSPDAGTDLTVYANYQHVDQKHGGGDFLPYYGTVKSTIFGRIPRDENYSEPDIDRYDRRQAMVGYELNHDFNDVWTVNSKARFAYADLKEAQLYPFGWNAFLTAPGADDALSRIRFDHHTESYSFTTDNSVTGKFSTGGVEHTVLFGVDYKFYGIDEVQASSVGTPIDVHHPDYGAAQPGTTPYIDEWVKLNQVGVYAQEQARFGGGFIATLNGRYDRYWLDGDVKNTGFDRGPDYSREGGRFSGRAGLGYEFANGVVPYVSVASTFNPLVGANLIQRDTNGDGFADGTFGRTAFKPETGVQYEAGVKWSPTWFPGLFTASIFELTKKNVVTGTTSPTTIQSQLGEVRSRGVEFEVQANLTENWKFLGSFTAYDLKIRKDAVAALVGDQPFLVPEVLGSAFLDYTVTTGALKGVSLGGGVRYLGKSWADQPNTLRVPYATLFDAAARYQWENYKISLNVTNLADKRYVSGCQGLYTCSYGEGRKALVKASYTW
ncbi:TonB-dependent siderophore receptor [Hansschlegelia plantiphila]|uniref:Ligand-gated channel n=1 Tax=Hansschlegelia plantiphila TaxID=374655 RepID=A0A9W6IY62_9HYPH|nr:TonB-dependent siderophore receptor [Hansschlegelia plantiphila]GLK67187.1 ligand-gated channel [Hansschlegelia plantiphila]